MYKIVILHPAQSTNSPLKKSQLVLVRNFNLSYLRRLRPQALLNTLKCPCCLRWETIIWNFFLLIRLFVRVSMSYYQGKLNYFVLFGHDENPFNEGRPIADGWHEGKIANRGDENAFMSVCLPKKEKLPLEPKLRWSDENTFMKSFSSLQFCLHVNLFTYEGKIAYEGKIRVLKMPYWKHFYHLIGHFAFMDNFAFGDFLMPHVQ